MEDSLLLKRKHTICIPNAHHYHKLVVYMFVFMWSEGGVNFTNFLTNYI